MYRGCMSDGSEPQLKCGLATEHGKGKCVKCSKPGCNDQPKLAKPKLSCLKCSDDKECAFGQESSEAEPCKNDVKFGEEETCFTHAISGNWLISFVYSLNSVFSF